MTEGERSIWEALVPVIVHPTKVAALEAMAWIQRPLCANDVANLIGEEAVTRSLASYHLARLHGAGVLKLSHTNPVRGTYEKFFVIA